VYFGYFTEGHKDMLRRVLKRANRMGFTSHGYDLDLNETSRDNLFHHCRSERHCLRHLSTVKSRLPGAMHLRQCGHNFVLPNTILINATLLLVHFFIVSLFYVYVYVLYDFFSWIMLCTCFFMQTCALVMCILQ